MPSSALAAMTHSQLGAHMIMNGTGSPNSQPRTRTRFRPQTRRQLRHPTQMWRALCLTKAEADDEGDDDGRRCDPEHNFSRWAARPSARCGEYTYRRQKAALTSARAGAVRPRVWRIPRKRDVCLAARGRITTLPRSSLSTKKRGGGQIDRAVSYAPGPSGRRHFHLAHGSSASSSPMRNALLWRFSNPMVEAGLPLRLRHH